MVKKLVLTVDVEDYFQATAFEKIMPRPAWNKMESRVEANTLRVLNILGEHGVTATFFVLGWVAERYPGMIRAIDESGHEVASHGYDHRLVYTQTPNEFREDVRRSKNILEEILRKPVLGYRAPTFSITGRSQWAHGILAEEGYVYSSSVFPVHHDRYGWPEFGDRPRRVNVGNGAGIWEFPLPFYGLGKVLIPFGGGGYLRIYPFWLTNAFLRKGSTNEEKTTVIYFHPWEIDPLQPRLPLGPISRLRHYWGLGSNEKRIRKILRTFQVESITKWLAFRQPDCGGEGLCAG